MKIIVVVIHHYKYRLYLYCIQSFEFIYLF